MDEQRIKQIVKKVMRENLSTKYDDGVRLVSVVSDDLESALTALNTLYGMATSDNKKIWKQFINDLKKYADNFNESVGQ